MELLIDDQIDKLIEAALAEDIGKGDATTEATIPNYSVSKALLNAREEIVLSGLDLASAVFKKIDPSIYFEPLHSDGDKISRGETIAVIKGRTKPILTCERVALNFLQRLCGIATLTNIFVEKIKGTNARILDTRKTTPGFRKLEKYAVRCGGGFNHRMGLYDQILIKDNHLAALRDEKPNAIFAAVKRARQYYPSLIVEVEADTLEQVEQALEAGADIVLLDNMDVDKIKQAVKIVNGKIKTEVSGGVNLQTVRAIAETGVDYISIGALTHSARAVDIALDFQE
ncbi:MAG: carboxylating nicotinate-nucleotide diphosphorylase [Verrucomicrobiia bacterium]